jgi:hypothetical protein
MSQLRPERRPIALFTGHSREFAVSAKIHRPKKHTQSDPLRRYIGGLPPKMPLQIRYITSFCSGTSQHAETHI